MKILLIGATGTLGAGVYEALLGPPLTTSALV
jgi:uncharacterized protein YbjT (DUF2867 family)